jgi:hypothetical protein
VDRAEERREDRTVLIGLSLTFGAVPLLIATLIVRRILEVMF